MYQQKQMRREQKGKRRESQKSEVAETRERAQSLFRCHPYLELKITKEFNGIELTNDYMKIR